MRAVVRATVRVTASGTVCAAARAAALAAALAVAPVAAAPHVPLASAAELDRQTRGVLERLAAGDVARATVLARQLARRYPRFALGQLLHAELTALAALEPTLVGSARPWSPALIELLLEARARLDTGTAPGTAPGAAPGAAPGTVARTVARTASPNGVARAVAHAAAEPPAPFVQIGRHVENVVLVDLARSTLALYAVRGGVAVPVGEHYVSSGSAGFGKWREGDRKTPLGLYRITGFRDDASLPELYGAGALMLDYPNAHDRSLGRTGSGIWLHGVPHARLSRAPRSSEGCVTMSNDHLLALRERIDPAATLVVLSGALPAPAATRTVERARYRGLFRRYREARAGRDAAATARLGVGAAGALGEAELEALGAMPAEAVTVLEGRVDGRPGTPDLLTMEFRLGVVGAKRVTLWWRRTADGGWTLALEDIAGPGA